MTTHPLLLCYKRPALKWVEALPVGNGRLGAMVFIDGNFGATSGIAEMLLQSHNDEIHLLPALPKAWAQGSVTGLCARGGLTVDIAWAQGKLASAVIRSACGANCVIRYQENATQLSLSLGASITLDGGLRSKPGA